MTEDAQNLTLLRSARFRKEREKDWERLDQLVTQVESQGMQHLSYEEARSLSTLYRQAINSLSVAREISLDRRLLDYLESLCARAYLTVYAPQESIRNLITNLLVKGIPQAVRRSAIPLLLGFAAMAFGAWVGFALFLQDPSWFYTFMPDSLAGGRDPAASTEYLRQSLYGTETHESDELGAFASSLFSHNTQIAIFIFATGVFWAAPSFALTFYNGTILGAFFGLFAGRGLGYDLFAWLSIHGVTELSAICIACAGGVQLGMAMILPGVHSRRNALQIKARDATKLVILAAIMLVVAALIEGFLRQLIQSSSIRLFIGWGIGLLWLLYFAYSGRSTSEFD